MLSVVKNAETELFLTKTFHINLTLTKILVKYSELLQRVFFFFFAIIIHCRHQLGINLLLLTGVNMHIIVQLNCYNYSIIDLLARHNIKKIFEFFSLRWLNHSKVKKEQTSGNLKLINLRIIRRKKRQPQMFYFNCPLTPIKNVTVKSYYKMDNCTEQKCYTNFFRDINFEQLFVKKYKILFIKFSIGNK